MPTRAIRRRIRRSANGVNLAADVNAVVATGRNGSATGSVTQQTAIMQNGGRSARSTPNQTPQEEK